MGRKKKVDDLAALDKKIEKIDAVSKIDLKAPSKKVREIKQAVKDSMGVSRFGQGATTKFGEVQKTKFGVGE